MSYVNEQPRRRHKPIPTAEEYRQRRRDAAQARSRAARAERLASARRWPEYQQLGMLATDWQGFVGSQAAARRSELAAITPAPHRGAANNERGLAEYLITRRLGNREVEGPALDRLRAANRSVERARSMLSSGRGNVTTDIARAGAVHESSRRTEIGRAILRHQVQNQGPVDARAFGRTRSAAASFVRAGNCDEYGDVVTHLHAGQLQVGERVHSVWVPGHAFSEVRRDDSQPRPDDAILDPWAEGPAILREDSRFAHGGNQVGSYYSYNAFDGPAGAAHERSEADRLTADPQVQHAAGAALAQMGQNSFHYPGGVYAPTPVTSQGFQAATDARVAGNASLHSVLAGVATYRSLGERVREAGRLASGRVALDARMDIEPG